MRAYVRRVLVSWLELMLTDRTTLRRLQCLHAWSASVCMHARVRCVLVFVLPCSALPCPASVRVDFVCIPVIQRTGPYVASGIARSFFCNFQICLGNKFSYWQFDLSISVLSMGAGCMRGLNNLFPAPGTDDVHRRFNLGPPSLLPEEAPWFFFSEVSMQPSLFVGTTNLDE